MALGATLVAALAAFWPVTGEVFVDGSAYGDERRLPLRVPGPLVAGPLELVWALVVAGVATGPLLLAARQWVLGAVAAGRGRGGRVVGAACAPRPVAALGRVRAGGPGGARPAGPGRPRARPAGGPAVAGPAPADSDALDLTRGAFGLALELRFADPVSLLVVRGRGESDAVTAEAVLVTPTRPGALLTEARARRLA